MAFRWSERRWAGSVLVLLATVGSIEGIYRSYMAARGFSGLWETVTVGPVRFMFPLQLPIELSVFLVAVFAWLHASRRLNVIAKDDPLIKFKVIRNVLFVASVFSGLLFLPYLLASSFFWAGYSRLVGFVSPLKQPSVQFLESTLRLQTLEELWKYSVSQNISAVGLLLAAALTLRKARRFRPR